MSAKRRIWACAAPSCGAQARYPPGAAPRHANGRRASVPSGCICVGGAADAWLDGVVWPVMGERPHLDLCPSAHPKCAQRSGSCARRVQRRPPDGSAKCFGCLLVGCRRAATAADPFLVFRRARARWRPRGHIEQFDAAGHCELTCCCFSLSRTIRLLTVAHGAADTCSGSFGSSRAAFWDSRSRHLGSLMRVPSGAKSHPLDTVS